MDSLLSRLSSGLCVDPEGAADAAAEDVVGRCQLHKNQGKLAGSQAARRRDHLQRQKRDRDEKLDQLREMAQDDTELSDSEQMETSLPQAFRYRKKVHHSKYANKLMFSEWMEETPDDLAESWFFKICPPGKRCLVISHRRSTRAYSACGQLLRSFPSRLPGGCRSWSSACHPTMLDCIWNRETNVFHVLDVISWNRSYVYDCETDFRFVWVSTKLEEDPRLSTAGRINPFPFCDIPCQEATPAALAAAAACPQLAAADGLLFYHRRAHYRPGVTPLVLWLKPFMLPEAVGVGLTPAQLGAPDGYTNMADFIAAFEARRKHRSTQQRGAEGRPAEEMEAEVPEPSA